MSVAATDQRPSSLSFVLVALAFCLYSLLSVPTPGVNEPHYLTKARATCDDAYGAEDFFLQSGNAHAVFFAAVGPLTTLLPLESVALAGRLLSLGLLAFAWTRLAAQLRLSPFSTLLSAVLFCLIAMTGNFSGEWVIGGFESKVPAYGSALLACATWTTASPDQRPGGFAVCGIWTGLAIAIHPVVGMWFAIGICLCELLLLPTWCHRSGDLPRWLLCGTVYCLTTVVLSLPGLIPALRLTLLSDVAADIQNHANRIQVFGRLSHHLDAASFPRRAWIHSAVLLTVTMGAWKALQVRPAVHSTATQPQKHDPRRGVQQRLGMLLLVSAALALCGAAIGWHTQPYPDIDHWEFKARWLRYYPFRFADALLPITCALMVASVIDRWQTPGRWTQRQQRLGMLAAVLILSAASYSIRPAAPSGYTAWKYWHWKHACRWIRDNTEQNSVFLTPRESFGFKWFAERAEYVCVKDCPQDAPGIVEWNRRLWRQYRWSRDAYQNDSLFDHDDLLRLRQQLGITHIITRRLGPFEDRPVYQNEVWRVYAVETDDVSAD
ncbi:MAG: hypothetical protein NXI04_02850 [Planctomycetaceae bacterium]|nr:hypothetical protein [Planctomycetaceae bacterium]